VNSVLFRHECSETIIENGKWKMGIIGIWKLEFVAGNWSRIGTDRVHLSVDSVELKVEFSVQRSGFCVQGSGSKNCGLGNEGKIGI
jgi:hypothetical protein